MDTIITAVTTFLTNYGVSAGTIAVIIAMLTFGLKFAGNYKTTIIASIKAQIFALVNKIETEISESGLGTLKKSKVFIEIMQYIPTIIKLFFTADEINKWIEICVLDMKLMLATITQEEYDSKLAILNEQ